MEGVASIRIAADALVSAYRVLLRPIHERRWLKNEERFEHAIEQRSLAVDPFFVIQIGALDGLMDDPISHWIKGHGWHGILVEPQKDEFARLILNYAEQAQRLRFEDIAIAAEPGERTLYRYDAGALRSDWQRGTATLLPRTGDGITHETVQCMTFSSLLRRHDVHKIDLLQIDAEG